MAVTFQYRCPFTGLSLTGSVYRDALNDAAGTSLTFTENTSRLGVYTATATVTAGSAFVRITGDLADSIDIVVPADGSTVTFGSNQSPIAVGSDGSVTPNLDVTDGVETNRTLKGTLRLILAALVGKLSGAATTTVNIRDTNDSKNRISATVDSSGNRSAVTLDDT